MGAEIERGMGPGNQDNSVPADPFSQTGEQQPVPAYGRESVPALASENPPLAGLDLPSREVTANTYSYGFAGLGGRHSFRRNLNASGRHQFNKLFLDR